MKDIIVGIDAGTSVIKSVAFSLQGEILAITSVSNTYESIDSQGVEQDLDTTWLNTAETLVKLAQRIPDLALRVAALSITGQGDGTWLIDKNGDSVCPAWLWLDSRAGQIVEQFSSSENETKRFQISGTGINACQQSAQLLFMKQNHEHLLRKSDTAFHCKDWLYFKLTEQRATDPSEACFTFGDFRTRQYSEEAVHLLGLDDQRKLLPPIVDGVSESHPLRTEAAKLTGLYQGTPVILGYVDVVCTALGAGLYDPVIDTGCTIVGSTGVHMGLSRTTEDVSLSSEQTGYTMLMPIDGVSANLQTNMSSTLNVDWLMDTGVELINLFAPELTRSELLNHLDEWAEQAGPTNILYQPYISAAGERGPFIDSNARAGFLGLTAKHRFPDLVRSVLEGLAFASRDCYLAMGDVPSEIRVTGGASKSKVLRTILGAVLGSTIRASDRMEAGASGAAMIATVNLGYYSSMDDCVAQWVTPYLGDQVTHDALLHEQYKRSFSNYFQARTAMTPVWKSLNSSLDTNNA